MSKYKFYEKSGWLVILTFLKFAQDGIYEAQTIAPDKLHFMNLFSRTWLPGTLVEE